MLSSQHWVDDYYLSISCTKYHVDLLMLNVSFDGCFELRNYLSSQLLVNGQGSRSQFIIKSNAFI
jgi:hypothetical protein